MESAHELYQVTDRMIDWSESSHRKVEIHTSTRINVRAAPSVCRKATLCVHVSGVCQCKCVSLYVCVCCAPAINEARLGPAAERGPQWATHPVGRSGEIQCP